MKTIIVITQRYYEEKFNKKVEKTESELFQNEWESPIMTILRLLFRRTRTAEIAFIIVPVEIIKKILEKISSTGPRPEGKIEFVRIVKIFGLMTAGDMRSISENMDGPHPEFANH